MGSRTSSPPASTEHLDGLQFTGGTTQTQLQIYIIIQRHQREYRMRLANLMVKSIGLLSSLLSFVIMATNNQGPIQNFDDFEEYRYCLAIAVIAFVYLAIQLGQGIYEAVRGYNLFHKTLLSSVDFIVDQTLAYVVMSSSLAVTSLTNNLWNNRPTKFKDMAMTLVTLSFPTFSIPAASSVLSGLTFAKVPFWFLEDDRNWFFQNLDLKICAFVSKFAKWN